MKTFLTCTVSKTTQKSIQGKIHRWTTELSVELTKILSAVKDKHQAYCETIYALRDHRFFLTRIL